MHLNNLRNTVTSPGTSRVNTSGTKTVTFQANSVNFMAADTLAPWITRSSTTSIFIMHDKWVLIFHEDRFQQSVPSHSHEMIENTNIFLHFLNTFNMTRVNSLCLKYDWWWHPRYLGIILHISRTHLMHRVWHLECQEYHHSMQGTTHDWLGVDSRLARRFEAQRIT